ncbi:hypothetical protein PC129_g11117 [Phytophthora cactorum]|uniref:Uncharacterized protein n=1 Tax=Phytophthora cactorum TaxID=29920 RepID=A0A8T1I2J4_9STRA|nr:hypothetical protein Pcac1_g1757 [Phytophthora cactorum]KAG2820606.1 hypothetical protein PC112_g11711 [Phytophthora cactorum]KAG2822740.1 hypothetical protein PC111_g10516 [Phytophthora cactorum]KAG2855690.1 hypothetical protein PC113_g12238 [Phytophthora cactorum]KAG2902171.1 hypothetical protein PC114_g12853 [Phytophthora cactorum]
MSGHLAARKRTPSLLLPSSRPKSSKPRGKGSALQEATEVAPKAVTSSGDAPADTGASSRRSRSPSLPKDDGPNPRFAVREHSPGTVAEARAKHDGSHSEDAAGERLVRVDASPCTHSEVTMVATAR